MLLLRGFRLKWLTSEVAAYVVIVAKCDALHEVEQAPCLAAAILKQLRLHGAWDYDIVTFIQFFGYGTRGLAVTGFAVVHGSYGS